LEDFVQNEVAIALALINQKSLSCLTEYQKERVCQLRAGVQITTSPRTLIDRESLEVNTNTKPANEIQISRLKPLPAVVKHSDEESIVSEEACTKPNDGKEVVKTSKLKPPTRKNLLKAQLKQTKAQDKHFVHTQKQHNHPTELDTENVTSQQNNSTECTGVDVQGKESPKVEETKENVATLGDAKISTQNTPQ